MMALLDNTCVKDLSEILEQLTHTGQKTLDPVLSKKLKAICRVSNAYVEHAFHLILHELNKEHAEIRYSAFQVLDELFRRSHCFRELVIADMRQIMDLTAETNSKRPLPLPKSVAQDLKRLALKSMEEWNKEFGSGYKKLEVGFNFLKHCKKIDFSALYNESLAEQARIEERQRRQSRVNEERLRVVNMEITELEPEIKNTITAMQNCISLLVPTPDNFFITDNDNEEKPNNDKESANLPSTSGTSREDTKEMPHSDDDSDSESINLREYGILSRHQKIEVDLRKEIKKVKETEANAAIIENARDLFRILNNHHLPSVKKWIQVISKATGASNQSKEVMDLKQLLETALEKYHLLKINEASHETSESSDSDFEEVVDKDGYEESVKEDLLLTMIGDSYAVANTVQETKRSWSIWSKENNNKDPTTPQCTLTAMAATNKKATSEVDKSLWAAKKSSTPKERVETIVRLPDDGTIPSTLKDNDESRKTKLLAVAPKLPFDVDLYHWEDEKVPIPTMLSSRVEGYQTRAASPAEGLEELAVPDGSVALRTRVIEYSGKFQPVKWACRAPLGNGKLCPRQDRVKCPFHGVIVPRGEAGECSNEEDAQRFQKKADEEKTETPDWQDPELLEEIKAATGVDLKMPDKKRRGKKKAKLNKYPGLTDIKAKLNTPHSRLSKKVFKKSAMKRISKALDTMDHKRFRDKYGDQFHYMYNTA